MTAAKRDGFLDFCKAILIVLVLVGHHIQFVFYSGSEGFWQNPVFKLIYIFHMPLFMALSGYTAGFGLSRTSLAANMRKRSLQLILPMAVWCAVGALSIAAFSHVGIVEIARLWASSFLGTYWFLWAVFYCYVITRAALYIPLKLEVTLLVIAVVLVLLPVKYYVYCMTSYMFPFFAIGYLANTSGYRIAPTRLAVAAALIAAIAIFFLWSPDTYIYNNHLNLSSVASALNIGLMFLGGAVFSLLSMWTLQAAWRAADGARLMPLIVVIGTATLQVYLVQDVYFRILRASGFQPSAIAFWLCVLPASIIVAVAVTWAVKRTEGSIVALPLWGATRSNTAPQVKLASPSQP